jgi:hypothetical protein
MEQAHPRSDTSRPDPIVAAKSGAAEGIADVTAAFGVQNQRSTVLVAAPRHRDASEPHNGKADPWRS